MMSHLFSHGRVFGSVSLSDAGYLLFFFDCLAFSLLVTYWDAAGRIGLRKATVAADEKHASADRIDHPGPTGR